MGTQDQSVKKQSNHLTSERSPNKRSLDVVPSLLTDSGSVQRAIENPTLQTLTPNVVLQLQQTIGNRAVQKLMSASSQRQSGSADASSSEQHVRKNDTALPDDLKEGIEDISGFAMDELSRPSTASDVLHLQRLIDNRATNQLLFRKPQKKELGRHKSSSFLSSRPEQAQDEERQLEKPDGKQATSTSQRVAPAPVPHNQRKTDGGSKPTNIVRRNLPRMSGAFNIQREWEGETPPKKWDKPIDGLWWFYNSLTNKLYYEVEDISKIPEPHQESISNAVGQEYTLEEWRQAGWSGAVQADNQEVENLGAPQSKFSGAFRVFEFSDPLQYLEEDPEFKQYYDEETGGDEIVIGVLDTGVLATSHYLQGHMKAAGDFSGRDKSEEEYLEDIQDYHGTKVAGQAAYGTEKIKLVDVRVQVGQIGGQDNSDNIARGITWAIEDQGAKVITCSVDFDWSKPAVQAVVDNNPNVIFLTSAGNNATEITERNIDAGGDEKENALLIGGVTLEKEKHPSRGFGSAVDVMVPSGAKSDKERALPVHFPKSASAKQELKGVEQQRKGKQIRLENDRGDLERAQSAEKKNEKQIRRLQKFVTDDEAELKSLDETIGKLKLVITGGGSELGSEAGVSFGIPVIANIAAKMLLINPKLTIPEIKQILTEVAVDKSSKELQDLSKSGGMVDPVKAYKEAAARR